VAPGYYITSLDYLTSGYAIKSGTSMATPHVSGAVAVLLQAARNNGIFLSPAQVRSIYENTSKDLGTAGKDNLYGAGRIDVYKSIREYAIFRINGTVLDKTSRNGIPDVIVSTNNNISTVTNASGFYSLTVLEDTYNLTAIFDPTYTTNNSITVSTIGKLFNVHDIELTKKPTGTINGRVKN
jgi:subtilisin family serine protease